MSGLFGGGIVNETARISALRIQTSCYGVAVPVVIGKQRCTGNMLYYGDLKAIRHEQSQGGKGGGEATSVWYTYRYSIQAGICEGPVSIGAIWMQNGDAKVRLDQTSQYGYTIYPGNTPNDYSTTLATRHPTEFFHYPGLANLTAVDMGEFQGDAPPAFSFEVLGLEYDATIGGADPADALYRIITDVRWGAAAPGASFPLATSYGDYAVAMGWSIGLEMAEQKPAVEWIRTLLDATNSAAVWAADHLEIVPYGDTAISANGRTWTPNVTPIYDLTDDHFMGDPAEPIKINRKADSETANIQPIEFRNAANEYNVESVEGSDSASVAMYGPKKAEVLAAHCLTNADAALRLGTIKVQRRQSARNEFSFDLPWTYCRLLPMDIVTLTDSRLGLNKYPVRLTRVVDGSDSRIQCLAEDFLAGIGHAALIPTQDPSGYSKDYNVSPGNASAPVMFEPPIALAGTPQVWLGTSGGDQWGGCNVWVSLDGISYSMVGTITADSRHGVTTSTLPLVADPDNTSVLGVDLAVSGGVLLSCSLDERDAWATLSYIGGELIGYRYATLTGGNAYNLSSLRRGAYGSPITSHSSGAKFLRLDQAVFRYPYDADSVGKTIHVKLQSFNLFGGGLQDISTLTDYTHTLIGAPLGTVTGLALEQPWTGTACSIKWTAFAGAATYKVEVYGAGVLRRTSYTPDLRYSYTYEDGKADGGPWRSLEFRVYAVSANGESSAAAVLSANNAQIGAPSNVLTTAGITSAVISADQPAATDYLGTRIHMSLTNGFTPDAGNLIYDGPNTSYFATALSGGLPHYFRVAQYDVFGTDSLTYSAQVSATPDLVVAGISVGEITGAMIAGGAIDTSKFASGIEPVGVVSALPNPVGYVGTDIVYLTTDSKLYRYTGTDWTVAVDGNDILAASIVAGKIAAGAISATEIAANAITVDKLAIGNFSNYLENPGFEFGNVNWTLTTNLSIANDPTHAYNGSTWVLKHTGPDATGRTATSAWRACSPGDIFYARAQMQLGAGATGTCKIRMQFGDAAFAVTNYSSTSNVVVGSWTKNEITATAPTNAAWVRYQILTGADRSAGNLYIDDCGLFKVSDGVLIADGAITATKVAAASITADKCSIATLSALTANMGDITAGTLTMDAAGFIKGGQTDYDIGDGFFFGYSGGAYKISARNGDDFLRWGSGGGLEISGSVNDTRPFVVGSIIVAAETGDLMNTSSALPNYVPYTDAAGSTIKFQTARPGAIRCGVYAKTTLTGGSTGGYVRWYKNGTAVGTEQAVNTSTLTWYEQDISGLVAGDKLEVRLCATSSSYFTSAQGVRFSVGNANQQSAMITGTD